MYSMIPARRSMNSLFNMLDAFDQNFNFSNALRTDIVDQGDSLTLEAELPGFTKEEIELEIQNGILTISAQHKEEAENEEKKYLCRERRLTSVKRSFQLEGIQEDGVTAEFENGVLKLQLPKQETRVSRRIELN